MATVNSTDIQVKNYQAKYVQVAVTNAPGLGPKYNNISTLPAVFSKIDPEGLLPPAPWNMAAEVKNLRTATSKWTKYDPLTKQNKEVYSEKTDLAPALVCYAWNGQFEKPMMRNARFDAETISLSQSAFSLYKDKELSGAITCAYPATLIDGAAGSSPRLNEESMLKSLFQTMIPNLGSPLVDLKKSIRQKNKTPSKLVSSIGVVIDIPPGTKYQPTTDVQKEILDADDTDMDVRIAQIVGIDDAFVKSHLKIDKALYEIHRANQDDFAAAARTAGWQGEIDPQRPITIEAQFVRKTTKDEKQKLGCDTLEYFSYDIFQRVFLPRGGYVDKAIVVTTNFGLTNDRTEGNIDTDLAGQTQNLVRALSDRLSNTEYSSFEDRTGVLLDESKQDIDQFSTKLKKGV